MIKLVVKAEVPEGGTKDFSYEFDQPVVTMGRLKENDIQLPLSTVSGFHAQILKEEDSHYLLDRGSINGTFLNGQKLGAGEKKLLNDGDIIKIQTFEIYYSTGITMMNIDAGATVQVARQMVMEVLGSWQTNVSEKPRIIVMGGPSNGKKFDLVENKALTVGRIAENDILIDHPSVSRKHAEISLTWSGAFIKDLKSANGVFVNDQRVVGSQKLRDRDEIRLGQQTSKSPVILVFSNPAEALLSKIEDMQVTDSSGSTPAAKPDAAQPAQAPPAAPAEAPAPEAAPSAAQAAPGPAGEVPGEEAPQEAFLEAEEIPAGIKSPMMPVALAAIGLLVLVVAGFSFYYLWGGFESASDFTADPPRGSTGDVITLRSDSFAPEKLKDVQIFDQKANVVSLGAGQLRIEVPDFPSLETTEADTEIVIHGKRGDLGKVPFTVLVLPRIKEIVPRSGSIGLEVQVKTNLPSTQPTILFGQTSTEVKRKTDKGFIVSVPRPEESIPAGGLKVPVKVRVNDRVSKNSIDFIILPAPVAAEEKFRLTFTAKPNSAPLGFNEYSVETNAGPLLVVTGRGQFGNSQERAEDAARNLNQAVDYFQQNSSAKVTLSQEGDHFVIFGEGGPSGSKVPMLSVFADDTQSYKKLAGHGVELDQLAQWWQMLLDAYFKVFVQFANPDSSGIVASGGQVFQQILNFYNVGGDNAKYYKKDLMTQLPADQKAKLLSLSYGLPQRVLSVDGKWEGAMTNNLYSNLSVKDLELVLTLRQNGESVSGSSEMNWKIIMGGSDAGFQNVAYRKLGSSPVIGTFRKTKAFPLEFSITEKQGRRLDFVGKVENDILWGTFVVSSTGDEGTFSLKLQR